MQRIQVIQRLQACLDDPMWAAHAEVSKSTLKAAIDHLTHGPLVWIVSYEQQRDAPYGEWLKCRVVYADSAAAEARASELGTQRSNRNISVSGSRVN